MSKHSTMLDHALDYAREHSWPVFPCDPATKRPLTDHGFKDASTDPAQIEQWWRKTPNAMIGVPTGSASHIVVLDLDFDPDTRLDGRKAIDGLELPQTMAVRTPRGGFHYYYDWLDGVEIRNSAGEIGKGVDVRGEGGYVIVPPSVNATGKTYQWVGGTELVQPPGWFVEKAKKKEAPPRQEWSASDIDPKRMQPYGDRMLSRICDECAFAPVGTRHDVFLDGALKMFSKVKGGYSTFERVSGYLRDAGLAAGRTAKEVDADIRDTYAFATPSGLPESRPYSSRSNGTDDNPQAPPADSNRNYKPNGPNGKRRRGREFKGFISLAEFLDGMRPPDYLADGLVLKGSTYTLTGNTGHCKTLILILLAIKVASGDWFCGRKCKKGKVVFIAGENPDNVKVQFYAMCRELGVEYRSLDIIVHEGVFDLHEMREKVQDAIAKFPDLALVAIDSLQAFFMGEEDNANMAMLDLAIDCRQLTEPHPNKPTTIITAHPVKNAPRDGLLPRGGSALTNELDGNLTAWADGNTVTLGWLGKLRGIPFDPITLEQAIVKPEGLVDAEGNQMPATIIKAMGETRASELVNEANRIKLAVLAAIRDKPDITQRDLAVKANTSRGTVRRTIDDCRKLKWLREYSGKYALTGEGKKTLEINNL